MRTLQSFRRHRAKCAARGRRSQKVQEQKRIECGPVVRPPDEWTHLKTIVVHDRLSGRVDQIDLFQGNRLNNYHVRSDEREWQGVSATELSVMLRHRWALRWLVE